MKMPLFGAMDNECGLIALLHGGRGAAEGGEEQWGDSAAPAAGQKGGQNVRRQQ